MSKHYTYQQQKPTCPGCGYALTDDDMNEEIYDPDCTACERAQVDCADLEQVADDLAALVRQLVRSLRKASPDNELPEKALDYLKRKGLQGSPLRHNAGGKRSDD